MSFGMEIVNVYILPGLFLLLVFGIDMTMPLWSADLSLVWLVGYVVVWSVCAVISEWERSHQRYLQTFSLQMGKILATELNSKSSLSEKNSISRASNFDWTVGKISAVEGGLQAEEIP